MVLNLIVRETGDSSARASFMSAKTRVALVLFGVLHSTYSFSADSADKDPIFNPIVDARGFIDVWQLRNDVALVPSKVDESSTDFCYSEGDPEAEAPSAKEEEKERLKEEFCIKKVLQGVAEYKKIFASFNRAWLPVMMDAIRKGDMVAEVILRQCDTTPAFDRSGIETTCDSQPRRSTATRRLAEIGFAPAQNTCIGNRLPDAKIVDYPRAFTFYRSTGGVWKTDSFACLSLHRRPQTPGYLVWGRELYYGGGNFLYTGLEFEKPSNEEIARHEAEIDRYLKQDSRWGVFLLSRVGRHEWVPQGTKSTTHVVDTNFEGVWEVKKETHDWTTGMMPHKGRAVIARNGELTQMTIQTEETREPLLNVENCTLRYSGGITFIPEIVISKGQAATQTSLGYFYAAGHPGSGAFWQDGMINEAVAPLDPKKQYKQVLMQCGNAESDDNTRIRFLLLAEDTLIEVAAYSAYGSKLAIRHYQRLKSGAVADDSRKTSLTGRLGEIFRDCSDCPEMVVLPGLTGQAFAIGKTEVTYEQWESVVVESFHRRGEKLRMCGNNCPIGASWNDTQIFIRSLNMKTGKQYRLPTEAEWEYACHAGARQEYCGSDNPDSVGWYYNNSNFIMHRVSSKTPNAFGLYDMTGNMWEWVEDCDNGDCSLRVLRGGSWNSIFKDASASRRLRYPPTEPRDFLGFRLVRMLP